MLIRVFVLALLTVACGPSPQLEQEPATRISRYSAEARTRGLVRVNNEAPPPREEVKTTPVPPPVATSMMKNYERDAAEANAANASTVAPCATSRAARVAAAWKEREAYANKLRAVRPFAQWVQDNCIYDADHDAAICNGTRAPQGMTAEHARFALEFGARGMPTIGSLGRYAAENESCEFADDQVGFDTQATVGDARLPPRR